VPHIWLYQKDCLLLKDGATWFCLRWTDKNAIFPVQNSFKRLKFYVLFIYSAKAAGRHVFVLASSSGLRGHKRTYLTILESAEHALFKMVKYVLMRPLRPELDDKTKTSLPAKTRFCHLDEQAISS
jgi:hypothetical protein